MINIPANWKCPKCGHSNVTLHNPTNATESNINYCDSDSGGCDEMFVVETTRSVEVTAVYSLKVEFAK